MKADLHGSDAWFSRIAIGDIAGFSSQGPTFSVPLTVEMPLTVIDSMLTVTIPMAGVNDARFSYALLSDRLHFAKVEPRPLVGVTEPRKDIGVVRAPVTTSRVLVIEDDPTVAEVVERYLAREGYLVDIVSDGAVGLRHALAEPPDLVVLDLMLPGLSGLEVCRQLRAQVPVPVIMLTARSGEVDRVTGLEIGADDYVAKPFSPRELTARVKAVLRRGSGVLQGRFDPAVLRFDELELDSTTREVRVGGELIELTVKEFELLAHLMRHPRKAFRREELLEQVWGFHYGDTSTVTVHVSRLREKIEVDPTAPRWVRTVRGVGYRFEP